MTTNQQMSLTTTDYEYYEWLCSKIHIPNQKTYFDLFERLHNVEFVWHVPNDDNRIQDALDLRLYFFEDRPRKKLHLGGATMLEVVVSLSEKVAFTAGGDAHRWAWKLLKNIGVTRMSDPMSQDQMTRLDDILYALIWRTYSPNGRGGFFPLKYPDEDQTKVEIWYQMNKYVIEGNHI